MVALCQNRLPPCLAGDFLWNPLAMPIFEALVFCAKLWQAVIHIANTRLRPNSKFLEELKKSHEP
jgi:hypothetical protein